MSIWVSCLGHQLREGVIKASQPAEHHWTAVVELAAETAAVVQSQSHVSVRGREASRKQGSSTERGHLPGDQPGWLETGKEGREEESGWDREEGGMCMERTTRGVIKDLGGKKYKKNKKQKTRKIWDKKGKLKLEIKKWMD